jgi:hypothetical protein
MSKEKLEQEKKQIEQQLEQAIATVNQLIGAKAYIEKLISELDKESKEEEKIEK